MLCSRCLNVTAQYLLLQEYQVVDSYSTLSILLSCQILGGAYVGGKASP